MSDADTSTFWTLRCEVREKLVEYLQNNYPQPNPLFAISIVFYDFASLCSSAATFTKRCRQNNLMS